MPGVQPGRETVVRDLPKEAGVALSEDRIRAALNKAGEPSLQTRHADHPVLGAPFGDGIGYGVFPPEIQATTVHTYRRHPDIDFTAIDPANPYLGNPHRT